MTLVAPRLLTLALLTIAPSVAADSRCRAFCNTRLAGFGNIVPTADRDADGIPDAREEQLARQFAPVVMLDATDWTRPASVQWFLSRLNVGVKHDAPPRPDLRLALFSPHVHKGSADPRDWRSYVHVFGSRNGRRLYLQYWFFYPYNDGSWVFNHEGDWEHVTVSVDDAGRPLGVHAARHGHNKPGKWRRWDRVRKLQGTHPRILSAKGSHASYFDEDEVGWQDSSKNCKERDGDCGRIPWRTWEGGGLAHLGELHAPREAFVMSYRGRWGASGTMPGTSAPWGPAFQSGWCADGNAACTRP